MALPGWRTSLRRDLGDFQTPPGLVDEVLACLTDAYGGWHWNRVLEPTCGRGNFIAGLLRTANPPREVWGLETQERYVDAARQFCVVDPRVEVSVSQADFLRFPLDGLSWQSGGRLLVIGNPPWVTNAELSCLGSTNLPRKTNLKGLRGIEAMTGESNFDIAEYIWLKLIKELGGERPTIALLCKTSVARNVLVYAERAGLPVTSAHIWRIDALRWFDAAVDACLFVWSWERRHEPMRPPCIPHCKAGTRKLDLGFWEGGWSPTWRRIRRFRCWTVNVPEPGGRG